MTKNRRLRFDVAALRALVGGKTFVRGEDYYREGQVEILDLNAERVLASVVGTDEYRTEVTGRGREVDGECSCPAFDDGGFCKHMIAVALAANAAEADDRSVEMEALARIREHLQAKGIDALVAMLLDLAERDAVLFRKLDLASAADRADDGTIEARLRTGIDRATHTRNYVDYRHVAGWAAGVWAALDAVAALSAGPRAHIAARLSEHAIGRIEGAFEEIDDSDGHIGELLHRARDIHRETCRTIRPEPVELARQLFAREMDDDFDTFAGAAEFYADALGDEGFAEYRRLAIAAWSKLLAQTAGGASETGDVDRFRLAAILDFFAERDGDLDARIALRAKDLSSPWRYSQLVEFCRAHGREEEALRWAEEGLWLFGDQRPDQRFVVLAAELLERADRKGEAEAHLWRIFEKAPSADLYARLCRCGGETARRRSLECLEALAAKAANSYWDRPADLLLRILREEGMLDRAWEAARKYKASGDAREELARASEATHPHEVAEAYAARIEELVNSGASHGYTKAAKLVARMAQLRDVAGYTAYVADLKQRHKRKRNFMKLLT
jgi:hypothetical protein